MGSILVGTLFYQLFSPADWYREINFVCPIFSAKFGLIVGSFIALMFTWTLTHLSSTSVSWLSWSRFWCIFQLLRNLLSSLRGLLVLLDCHRKLWPCLHLDSLGYHMLCECLKFPLVKLSFSHLSSHFLMPLCLRVSQTIVLQNWQIDVDHSFFPLFRLKALQKTKFWKISCIFWPGPSHPKFYYITHLCEIKLSIKFIFFFKFLIVRPWIIFKNLNSTSKMCSFEI